MAVVMTIAAPSTFLHLASDPCAADVVKEAVRRLGREEVVLGSRDALADGPLQDVDDGAASRVEWWGRIYGACTTPNASASPLA